MSRKESHLNYRRMEQKDVPQGRRGKHHMVVGRILSDLTKLTPGEAIRVPLQDLGDSKENLRAALSRAAHKNGARLYTSADETFLYVWRTEAGGH